MTKTFTTTLAFIFIATSILLGQQMDSDNDGMPDDFEGAYFLNENDPTDAFGDGDGDQILNLQEYILGTEPHDDNSDLIYEHDAADPLENIYSRMRTAGAEPALIRMSEGEYEFDYGFFADGDYKLMIQGGWNADFSEYDPCQYPTVLRQAPNGIGGTISTAAISGTGYNVVLDGLELVNGTGGLAPLELINDASVSLIHLHNLKVHGNPTYGALISGRFGCTAIDLTVSGCSFTQNASGGITFASDGNPVITSRIINCTFDNPDALEGAIEFRAGAETTKNIKVVNSILWNNGSKGPFSETFVIGSLSLTTENCAFDTATLGSMAVETNTISVAPEFLDSTNGDYTLVDASPLVDAGIMTGLSFNGNGMDIGAVEAGGCIVSSIEDHGDDASYTSYPNPVINELTVELDFSKNYLIEVADVSGRICSTEKALGVNSISIDLSSYDKGLYFLRIQEANSHKTAPAVKVIKF